LVDGVEHRDQPGQRLDDGLLLDGGPVAVDALAVVGVLRLQPLQVGGPFGQLGRHVGGLLAVLDYLPCHHLWGLFGELLRFRGVPFLVLVMLVLGLVPGGSARRGAGCPGAGCLGAGGRPAGTSGAGRLGRRVLPPNLAGNRVDAPVVMNDRTGARLLGSWHQRFSLSPSPSSTISASTTSSSSLCAPELPSADSDCEAACCAWACW